MDLTAVAVYAQETGALVRGLLWLALFGLPIVVGLAIAVGYQWRQIRRMRRGATALERLVATAEATAARLAKDAEAQTALVSELERDLLASQRECRRLLAIRAKLDRACKTKHEELQTALSELSWAKKMIPPPSTWSPPTLTDVTPSQPVDFEIDL